MGVFIEGLVVEGHIAFREFIEGEINKGSLSYLKEWVWEKVIEREKS